MKCHQYQYAEVLPSCNIRLCGKSYPILSYEVRCSDEEIIGVNILVDGRSMYFKKQDVMLYKASSALIKEPEKISTESLWRRFLKLHGLKKG